MKTFPRDLIDEAIEEHLGYCFDCGARRDSCEPDARNYECPNCGAHSVHGARWLVDADLIALLSFSTCGKECDHFEERYSSGIYSECNCKWWNGRQSINRETDSQWTHERLYRTKSDRWVLHRWSQYQSMPETYTEIVDSEAAQWLVENGHEHADFSI